MKKYLLSIVAVSICMGITACGGGGGSSAQSNTNPYAGFSPYPYPESGNYQPLPYGFESAIPSFVTTTSAGLDNNGLQIAYGYNNIPAAQNLVAGLILENAYICSATPIQPPVNNPSGGTWLIGAAHCFVSAKTNKQVVSNSDILTQTNIAIYKGVSTKTGNPFAASAVVYIRGDYCQGSTFSGIGECPNFSPSEGAAGGQGNDIALIHIDGTFNSDPESSPQIAATGYPTAYTMAPVLSLGYGNNTVTPTQNGTLFYVLNYFYEQSDDLGYHYLYNSYFNNTPGSLGYSALICGGDSGGGDLFWNGSNWTLLSEHTYGPSGNSCGVFYNSLPNGATNVSAYYAWLAAIIEQPDPVAACNTSGSNCATNG